MTHNMTLFDHPFKMIKSGQKTIELRLNDEKRSQIKVGDEIIFSLKDDPSQTIHVQVIALHHYPTFEALYSDLPLLQCGYDSETIKDASPHDMDRYYTPEKQRHYGVLGIEIRRQ
ncbi:MAG: ASCH domain-containing protein [Erysipelotrichaceae bacterium]|nr:ASCH domain-containing protein [Erysipelotrichaceae bacterium]